MHRARVQGRSGRGKPSRNSEECRWWAKIGVGRLRPSNETPRREVRQKTPGGPEPGGGGGGCGPCRWKTSWALVYEYLWLRRVVSAPLLALPERRKLDLPRSQDFQSNILVFHPLISSSINSSFPALRLSQHQESFQVVILFIRCPKLLEFHPFGNSVLPVNIRAYSFRMDWTTSLRPRPLRVSTPEHSKHRFCGQHNVLSFAHAQCKP